MDISPALATPLEGRDLAADERLAVEARSDPAVLALIYERHVGRVFGLLRARGASEDLAADLTATTFERALGHVGRPAHLRAHILETGASSYRLRTSQGKRKEGSPAT